MWTQATITSILFAHYNHGKKGPSYEDFFHDEIEETPIAESTNNDYVREVLTDYMEEWNKRRRGG